MVLIGGRAAAGEESEGARGPDRPAPAGDPAEPQDAAPAPSTPPAQDRTPPVEPPEPEGPEEVTPTRTRGRFTLPGGPLLPLGAVIVLGIVIAAVVVTTGFKNKPINKTTPTTNPNKTTTTAVPLTTVTNSTDGFSVAYPSTWEHVVDPNVPLLVVDPNTKNAFQIEVFQLAKPVDTHNIAQIKAVTDTILASANIKIQLEKSITLNGLPGYYYFYLYKASTGQVGANAQEFVFQGRKLTDITFQALPYTNFGPLGATFDTIANSYKSNPNVLGPVPSITPPTTTRSTTRSTATTKTTTRATTKAG